MHLVCRFVHNENFNYEKNEFHNTLRSKTNTNRQFKAMGNSIKYRVNNHTFQPITVTLNHGEYNKTVDIRPREEHRAKCTKHEVVTLRVKSANYKHTRAYEFSYGCDFVVDIFAGDFAYIVQSRRIINAPPEYVKQLTISNETDHHIVFGIKDCRTYNPIIKKDIPSKTVIECALAGSVVEMYATSNDLTYCTKVIDFSNDVHTIFISNVGKQIILTTNQ